MCPAARAKPCAGRAGSRKPGRGPPRAPHTRSSPRLACAPAPTDSPVGPRQPESPTQPAAQLLLQARRRHVATTGQRSDHHPIGFVEAVQYGLADMTQPTRDPMALNSRADRFGHDQTDPRTLAITTFRPPHVDDQVGLHRAHPVFHRRVKLGRPPHAVACGKHRQKPDGTDQTDSARRPLRRRPDTIARPARVRIRNRKPCTRARRRLFGWKVRLPLATAFSSLSLSCLCWSSGHSHFANVLVGERVGRVLLLAGAVPAGEHLRVAAASPAFGRLFEGTDAPPPGQTWLAPAAHRPVRPTTVTGKVTGKDAPPVAPTRRPADPRPCSPNVIRKRNEGPTLPKITRLECNRTVGSRAENC